MNKILVSTKKIVDNSQHVKINQDKIELFIENYEKPEEFSLFTGDFSLDRLNDIEKINFLVLYNALNFCYWGDPKWQIEYKGKSYDGAYGMIAAMFRAIDNNLKILDWEYCQELSDHHLLKLFQGNQLIPLILTRSETLKNLSRTIINNFEGDFRNLLKKVNNVEEFLSTVGNNFFAFKDVSIIGVEFKKIYFYKKAQLLLVDLKKYFPDLIPFDICEELTASADYKLPQALRKLGILSYDDKLANKIDNKELISHNSEEEIEIRSATIWAVEYIKEGLIEKGFNTNAVEIDSLLWLSTQKKYKDDKPYHLCETIFY